MTERSQDGPYPRLPSIPSSPLPFQPSLPSDWPTGNASRRFTRVRARSEPSERWPGGFAPSLAPPPAPSAVPNGFITSELSVVRRVHVYNYSGTRLTIT